MGLYKSIELGDMLSQAPYFYFYNFNLAEITAISSFKIRKEQ